MLPIATKQMTVDRMGAARLASFLGMTVLPARAPLGRAPAKVEVIGRVIDDSARNSKRGFGKVDGQRLIPGGLGTGSRFRVATTIIVIAPLSTLERAPEHADP